MSMNARLLLLSTAALLLMVSGLTIANGQGEAKADHVCAEIPDTPCGSFPICYNPGDDCDWCSQLDNNSKGL